MLCFSKEKLFFLRECMFFRKLEPSARSVRGQPAFSAKHAKIKWGIIEKKVGIEALMKSE